MVDNPPPELKPFAKFLTQAKRLETVQPAVSYYCRMYVMEQSMSLPAAQRKAVTPYLGALMKKLEKDKKEHDIPAKEQAKDLVQNFALQIFNGADEEEREGNASKKTVGAFFSSYCFFEILKQFGPRSNEIEEKMKYAMWKMSEINKTLKSGGSEDLGDTQPEPKKAPVASPAVAPSSAPSKPIAKAKGPIPSDVEEEAKELIIGAKAALQFKDVSKSVDKLKVALQLLAPYS